jgi:hypothetical protein
MDKKTKEKSKDVGANAYVTKPIKYDMITAVLDKFVDKNLVKNNIKDSITATIFEDFDNEEEVITVTEFLDDFNNIDEILDRIDELDDTLEILINNLTAKNIKGYLEKITQATKLFTKILANFINFDHTIHLLVQLQDNIIYIDFKEIDQKTEQKIFEYLYNILNDITTWTKGVFITKDIQNVLYINRTITSNCKQIESIIK